MTQIVVVNLVPSDAEKLNSYRSQMMPELMRHGASVIAAGPSDTLEQADGLPLNPVVLSFPTQDAAQAWFDDPTIAHLHALRNEAADSTIKMLPAFAQ